MDSTVRLVFLYTEQDIVRAMRLHYSSRLRLMFGIVLMILLADAGFYLWGTSNSRWYGITLVAIAGWFCLILVAVFFIIPPIIFRRNTKFLNEYDLTFSPDVIHLRTAQIDSQLEWNIYSRVLVDSSSFVLYHRDHHFTVIPKRAFQTEEQQNAFDLLLSQKIPKIVRKS